MVRTVLLSLFVWREHCIAWAFKGFFSFSFPFYCSPFNLCTILYSNFFFLYHEHIEFSLFMFSLSSHPLFTLLYLYLYSYILFLFLLYITRLMSVFFSVYTIVFFLYGFFILSFLFFLLYFFFFSLCVFLFFFFLGPLLGSSTRID